KPSIEAIREHGADMGIAWDGDFDRCFFFDENADFVEGYYIVGLLAQSFLEQQPGSRVIHDPRLTWNTIEIAREFGGEAIQCKTGHDCIEKRMHEKNAIYGGKISAHPYFRDYAYCDSGLIPWRLVAQMVSKTGMSWSNWVKDRLAA